MDTASLSESLAQLARNHAWTWSSNAQAIFEALAGYDHARHPVQVIHGLDDSHLDLLLSDDQFMDRLQAEMIVLAELTGRAVDAPDVAYFSPEFGLSDLIPQYSGGLGILAGDHLKAASDLGLALAGVGLFYRGGFFRQQVWSGKQVEQYHSYTPEALGCVDSEVEVDVPFPGRDVVAKVWLAEVGSIPLLLLDTDVAQNNKADRTITDRLYSGDRRHRLEQEMVLGVGGARALTALGWNVPVHHLNEGHAGFLILDLLDRQIGAGHGLDAAVDEIRSGVVFTTHTPVPAGIDRFDIALATEYLQPWAQQWRMPIDDVLTLGTDPDDDPEAFNMAALCLKIAGRANGVSKLHGAVSRELFASVPGGAAISSVTNGVHARTWVMPRLQNLFDDVLGHGWANGDHLAWTGANNIDDDTIRDVRRAGGGDLHTMVGERTGAEIDPDALLIGFARRFATYKRANLILLQRALLAELLGDDDRPVQFIFAGKAHPADPDGKAVLADIIAFAGSADANGRFLFVPDYDIAVARAMYAGCDVWLNNPVRPREASGTSGEKSALNGGLNYSISDGWWDEMADGHNGWTIPASAKTVPAKRDLEEAATTLNLLANEIVPEYFADAAPWSRAWLDRIRHNWTTLGPQVTAARMVADYRDQLYRPALDDVVGR